MLLLSDPAIHYYNHRKEDKIYVHGRTDRGRPGIKKFFATHECTWLCYIMTNGFKKYQEIFIIHVARLGMDQNAAFTKERTEKLKKSLVLSLEGWNINLLMNVHVTNCTGGVFTVDNCRVLGSFDATTIVFTVTHLLATITIKEEDTSEAKAIIGKNDNKRIPNMI
eukprot:1461982-Ditylum_brightwellii.AAC.1